MLKILPTAIKKIMKWSDKRKIFLFLFSSYCILILHTHTTFAATVSLDPASGSFGPGDMFIVTVRLDTDPGECINAANIELNYPTLWLRATAFSKGESLLSLWPEEPVLDIVHGKVAFSGGIPAGYCGRVQGDPGKTNVLGKVVFSVAPNPVTGNAPTGSFPVAITFASSTTKILENDGFGTEATLTKNNASITRMLTSPKKTNQWTDIVGADATPPDDFAITVAHDANTFDGKFFIVFSTVDKQSGVHHYEVMEDDPARLGFVYGKNVKSEWKTVTSPYLLSDQTLSSRVVVRAVDNAGNIQEKILGPTNGDRSLPKHTTSSVSAGVIGAWCVVAALTGILMGGILLFIRRRKQGDAPEASNHTEEVTKESGSAE